MNVRKAALVLSVVLATTLASCGTARRAGKDLFVAIASPAIALYGGGVDGYESAVAVRNGLDSSSPVEVLALPFTFLYHTFEHAIYCGIHAVDFFLFPAYGLAELHPAGPEVRPLDFYSGTWFDETPQPMGTDPETGEEMR